jgi:peptidyl-prolyl cis-trans isomerase D
MFDFFRNHTRLALGAILLLIIPSFVFFGVEGYTSFRDGSNAPVAKVDGVSITRAEWEEAHRRTVDRMRRENPDQDNAGLDTPAMRQQTLDTLVRERVLFAAGRQMHLAPTDERLKRLFATDPQYASIRNPDGSVNRELLGFQGMTSETLAQRLRQDLASSQVLGGLFRTSVAPASVANASLDALLQRREVQIQRFDPLPLRAKVSVTDAQLQAHYDKNVAQFKAPEMADIEYVVLDLATIGKGFEVKEEELRKFYDDKENASRFGTPEERRASHVLIKTEKDASAADKAKAKARAEELLAQARKNPAGFAELARKNSQDPGSAAQGGDLDFFVRGAMVKAFEDAAFTLKQGEISEVFETEFGYHFLTVTGARGGQKKPFEEVRAQIESELRTNKAKVEWAKLAENFTNMVYEQSDSLKPVVDKLKLELKTATVQRNAGAPAPGAAAYLSSPKLLDAVFGNEAVNNKRNTDAVETAANQLVSARVVKHTPARTLPLAEVKDRVREALVSQMAADLARADGEKRVAELKASSSAEPLPLVLTLSRLQSQGAPRNVVDAVMAADSDKLPAVVGVDLGVQGYLAIRVVKVLPREDVAGAGEQLRTQYAQAWAAAEAEQVLAALKLRFKAEIKADAKMVSDAASAAGR